jgi:hypothetical protein
MIQYRNPCKVCLVRPICNQLCKKKKKFYHDRESKLPLIAVVTAMVLSFIWIGFCHYIDNTIAMYVGEFIIIAIYTKITYNWILKDCADRPLYLIDKRFR